MTHPTRFRRAFIDPHRYCVGVEVGPGEVWLLPNEDRRYDPRKVLRSVIDRGEVDLDHWTKENQT